MLLVQKYLETHTFGELARDHGVYASFSKSGHKFSLNYDQIEAKESDPLSQECRGLVLAAEDGHPFSPQVGPDGRSKYDDICPRQTTILAYPMKRFFNHGQGSAAPLNWSDPNLAILEKLDGTLCIVYFDKFTHLWCVATRSVPEADLLMDNGIYTFRTLFEKALSETNGDTFEEFTTGLNTRVTYCFELTTPYNRIVVRYDDCRITMLAARQLYGDLNEFDLKSMNSASFDADGNIDPHGKPFDLRGVRTVQAHMAKSIEELLVWVSSMNPMDHEGVVVVDSNFNRVKVKNAAYVAYNRLHDRLGSSERNIMEFILLEKDDDVMSFLAEEIGKNMVKFKAGLQLAIKKYDDAYAAAKAEADAINPGDKKTFAILVTKNKDLWNAPFFQMFDGKAANMKDFILKNRKDGTWGDGFIDKLLELAKKN